MPTFPEKRETPLGIRIIAGLLMGASVYKMIGLCDFAYYQFMFQPLPSYLILLRYLVSWALRLAGLLTGIGLLTRKEIFRKTAIALGLLTITLVYFKHPPYVFKNIAVEHERHFLKKADSSSELVYPLFPWVSLAFYYVVDISFAGAMIYYLTRPQVKEKFH